MQRMMCLGETIRQARRRRGLTQEKLAEQTGVSRAAIARFEAGEIEPSLKTLLSLADALKMSTDELLGREPPGEDMLSPAARAALQTLIREIRKETDHEE